MNATSGSPIALAKGANRGIGFEVCCELAEKGYQVVLGSTDPGQGAGAAKQLGGLAASVICVQLDLVDPKSVENAAATLERQFGRIDVLVNSAGALIDDGQPPGMTDRSFSQRALDTNFFWTWRVIQTLVPLLSKSVHQPVARRVAVAAMGMAIGP